MSKRLTATEKWNDGWFRKLSVEAKVLFEFIRDNCDIAGFWEVDLEIASFYTGVPQELKGGFDSMQPQRGIEGAYKELERGYIGSDKYIWLKNFLYHQKNLPLNPDNPCHKGILNIIHSHNTFGNMVLEEIEKQIKERGLQGATLGLQSPTGKGKGKGKGNRGIIKGEQEIVDIAFTVGISEEQAKKFYHHFNKKNWVDGAGQKITDIPSALVDWRNNQFKFQQPAPDAEVGADGLTARERYWEEQEGTK